MLEAELTGPKKQPCDAMPLQLRVPAAKGTVEPTHHRRRVIKLKPLDDPGMECAAGAPAAGILTSAVLAQPPALRAKVQPGLKPAPVAAGAGSPTSVLERGRTSTRRHRPCQCLHPSNTNQPPRTPWAPGLSARSGTSCHNLLLATSGAQHHCSPARRSRPVPSRPPLLAGSGRGLQPCWPPVSAPHAMRRTWPGPGPGMLLQVGAASPSAGWLMGHGVL